MNVRLSALGAALLAAASLAGCAGASGRELAGGADPRTPVTLQPSARSNSPSASESAVRSVRHTAAATPRISGKRAHEPRWRATGHFRRAGGRGERFGRGRTLRYVVSVETGVHVRPAAFARTVDAILGDRRSWIAEGFAYRRVHSRPVDFRVVLAAPNTVDRLCAPLQTRGRVSCATGHKAVLNVKRWLRGADAYRGDLTGYRRYLVNHEVGHVLGHQHRQCPRKGALAPVMMQQTYGIGQCRKNPWPHPHR